MEQGQIFLGQFDKNGIGFGCNDNAVDPCITLAVKLGEHAAEHYPPIGGSDTYLVFVQNTQQH